MTTDPAPMTTDPAPTPPGLIDAAVAPDLAVVIPASNEAGYIGRCLEALLAQDADAGRVAIVVAANACTDDTAGIVARLVPRAAARGWTLVCDAHPEPGKTLALNRAEALLARGRARLSRRGRGLRARAARAAAPCPGPGGALLCHRYAGRGAGAQRRHAALRRALVPAAVRAGRGGRGRALWR